jgi:hypothetical protein
MLRNAQSSLSAGWDSGQRDSDSSLQMVREGNKCKNKILHFKQINTLNIKITIFLLTAYFKEIEQKKGSNMQNNLNKN